MKSELEVPPFARRHCDGLELAGLEAGGGVVGESDEAEVVEAVVRRRVGVAGGGRGVRRRPRLGRHLGAHVRRGLAVPPRLLPADPDLDALR